MNTPNLINPEALLDALEAACSQFGLVDSIRLFCRREQPINFFAMVRMDKGQELAAEAIGGVNSQGLVCKLGVLDVAFRCHNRVDGTMRVASCNDCRRIARQVMPDR